MKIYQKIKENIKKYLYIIIYSFKIDFLQDRQFYLIQDYQDHII